jgi:hypothetical protein
VAGFSVEEALSAYGYVYTMANAIPELKDILNQAIAGAWTPDRLTAEIESSPWWMHQRGHRPQPGVPAVLRPGTYAQNLANAKNSSPSRPSSWAGRSTTARPGMLALQTLTENASWDDRGSRSWSPTTARSLRRLGRGLPRPGRPAPTT